MDIWYDMVLVAWLKQDKTAKRVIWCESVFSPVYMGAHYSFTMAGCEANYRHKFLFFKI